MIWQFLNVLHVERNEDNGDMPRHGNDRNVVATTATAPIYAKIAHILPYQGCRVSASPSLFFVILTCAFVGKRKEMAVAARVPVSKSFGAVWHWCATWHRRGNTTGCRPCTGDPIHRPRQVQNTQKHYIVTCDGVYSGGARKCLLYF